MFLCELLLKSLSVIIASVPTRAKFNRFSRKSSRKIKGRGQETEGLSSHHGNLVRWVNRMVAATDKKKKKVLLPAVPHSGQIIPSLMMWLLGRSQEGVRAKSIQKKVANIFCDYTSCLSDDTFEILWRQIWRWLKNIHVLTAFFQISAGTLELITWLTHFWELNHPLVVKNFLNFFKMGTWTQVRRYDLLMTHYLATSLLNTFRNQKPAR